jgi:ATP-dependent Lon protease
VIIPAENEKDLAEIPKNILRKLEIHPVSTIDEVLKLALVKAPAPAAGTLDTKTALSEVSDKEARTH